MNAWRPAFPRPATRHLSRDRKREVKSILFQISGLSAPAFSRKVARWIVRRDDGWRRCGAIACRQLARSTASHWHNGEKRSPHTELMTYRRQRLFRKLCAARSGRVRNTSERCGRSHALCFTEKRRERAELKGTVRSPVSIALSWRAAHFENPDG